MTPLVSAYQAAAVALDEYFCGYDKGRAKTDPVYQAVCEGRDVPATYESMSTCADRAHARLWRLGCRLPFVNREERTPAPGDWKIGWNISLLHDIGRGSPCLSKTLQGGQRVAVPPGEDWAPAPGDELIIWTHPHQDPKKEGRDAHSLSILDFDGKVARTANFGASGMSKRVFPGAEILERPLAFDGKRWRYGKPGATKVVMRVLRLEDIVPTLTEPPNLTYIDGDMLPEMSRAYDEIMAARGWG